MILLYTMTLDHVPSANEPVRLGFISFGRDCLTCLDAILAIDNWCSQNRGEKKRVNFAMSRSVSPLACRYLSMFRPIPFQDDTVLCIWSAVCNSISLIVGCDASDRLWMVEAARIAVFERWMNYASIVHQFTHVERVIRAHHHGTVSLDHVVPPPGAFIQGMSSSRLTLSRSSDVSWLLRLSRGAQAGL